MEPSCGSTDQSVEEVENVDSQGEDEPVTVDARREKFRQLQHRAKESAVANRKDVTNELKQSRFNAQENKRLERKRRIAEVMQEKIDAEETGEDLDRKRNWSYTIEDNEKWDKKQSRKASRAQFEFTDYDDTARRKYKKEIDAFRPDLAAYRAQKEIVLAGMTSDAVIATNGSDTVARAEELLYRDANSFVYADHKPSDDAIDRVVQHINLDIDKRNKRSRVRKEDEGDVTYINDRNKVFNKKLERYFNKYTQEIRDNFERGTAL